MGYLSIETVCQYLPTFKHPSWRIWDMTNGDWLSCEGEPLEFNCGDDAYTFLKEIEDFR